MFSPECRSGPSLHGGGSRQSTGRRTLIALFALFLAAMPLLLVPERSLADSHSGYLVDHGIAIYYAVIPAEMIRGHPKQHPEAQMHGGVPDRPRVHHVMVALFNASTLERITNAAVTATVGELGLAGEQKRLQPFTVADALTYGNYFELRPRTHYRVRADITVPGFPHAARAEFGFKHE